MQEILHRQLSDQIKKMSVDDVPSVCLIHGQEMLVERSTAAVMEKLLGSTRKDMSCETMDGLAENIPDVLEKMNTFSLLAGPKIVVFKDARLFESKSGHQKLVDQLSEAYAAGEMRRAAKSFLNLCSRLDLDIEAAVRRPKRNQTVNALFGLVGAEGVQHLGQYCLDQGWSPAAAKDRVSTLQTAIEKGFPDRHYLLISVNSKVPKNLKFYKLIRDRGMVIDCNVPMGERRADKAAQEAVLRQTLDQKLDRAGKKLPAGLFQSLCQLTGFELRTFVQNVDKLIDYVGPRTDITAQDIDAVLERTKADPVFEFTNAVADRNLRQALFYLTSLLGANWHPLQILSALSNQMRKLLVAKDFTRSRWGRSWAPGMLYPQFQGMVMSGVEAFDDHVREACMQWNGPSSDAAAGKNAKKKTSDVVLAPNPKNAYPVYQTLIKSEKYRMADLLAAMRMLNEADVKLKSSPQDPALVIKTTVTQICRPSRK